MNLKILVSSTLISLFFQSLACQTISAGAYHSIFVCTDGTAQSSGNNSNGRLGDSSIRNRSTPVDVVGLKNIISASSYEHSLFLAKDGYVWACGKNSNGELGSGKFSQGEPIPQLVKGISNVIDIASGLHSLFLKSDGTVFGCGQNYGALGNEATGPQSNVHTPIKIYGVSEIIDIAAGKEYSLFLKKDGTVWGCGKNQFSEIGIVGGGSILRATQLPSLSNIVKIDAYARHSLFLKSDGTVWVCGTNTYGELGDNTTTDKYTPIQLPKFSNVVNISAGGNHSLFLKSDGTVWACGSGASGQLGTGTTNSYKYPVKINELDNVVAIAAGGRASLFLKSDGTVWACGMNYDGELGVGNLDKQLKPVRVMNLCDVKVGVKKLLIDEAFIAQPNPFGNELSVVLENYQFGNIEITDALGKSYFKDNHFQFGASLDTSNWPDGVYFIITSGEFGFKIKKVVKCKH